MHHGTLLVLVAVGLLGVPRGASAQAAALTAPHALPSDDTVELHVVGSRPDLILLHQGERTGCQGDCTLRLRPGPHRFSVMLPDGEPQGEQRVSVERPGLLELTYRRRSGTRGTGWVLFSAGLSVAALGAGFGTSAITSGSVFGVLIGLVAYIVGGVNFTVAMAAGLPLAAAGDSVEIRFE